MKAIHSFFVLSFLVFLGSCVVVPVADDSSPRPHLPPPPQERPIIRIADLEAIPARFAPGRPIDFMVKIANTGGHGFGFDVGVFHETRVVGWLEGIEIPRGTSTFRLKDDRFAGEPGSYVVKVRYRGGVVDERKFSAWPAGDGRFVIDPGQVPREKHPPVDHRRQPDGRHAENADGHKPPWNDKWVSVADLETSPKAFLAKRPVDFVVKITNRGPAAPGFDIGIFHEGRLVGWEMNKRLDSGINVFKVRDDGFNGDPGSYIVKVRRAGHIIDEKRFATSKGKGILGGFFTLDPAREK